MKILNATHNTILAETVDTAEAVFSRTKGLLGKEGLQESHALLIRPCKQIHTFFMRFPIDVVFVNARGQVIKIIPDMQPFRLSGIYLNAALAVELPAGTLKKTSTQPGDSLLFE